MPDDVTAVYRILDVNANRAAEGLRVIEEYTRFLLDDRHLTSLVKQVRHDLASSVAQLPASNLNAARDTLADVGTTVTTSAESIRHDPLAVAVASMKRVEQSLRCLEEYGKVVSPSIAASFEQLRYRSYTLHRAIVTTNESLQRLQNARLYVLIDGGDSLTAFEQTARELIHAGVDVLQLRDKQLDDRTLLERGRRLRELTRNSATLFVMNDRPDLAALSDADGVHVGQEELSVKDARAIVGPTKLIGVSTHSLAQAKQAVLDGANYIGCGPTFPSETKQFSNFPGLAFLKSVADEIQLPAFAIGGIALSNVASVFEAGLRRVAVSGAIARAADRAQAVTEWKLRLANFI